MPVLRGRRLRVVRASDISVALLVCVLMLVGSLVSLDDFQIVVPEGHTGRLPGPAGLTLVLVGSLVLAFRLVAPVPVLVVAAMASLTYAAIGYRPEPLPLTVGVALYTVALIRRPVIAGAATLACVLTLIVGTAAGWLTLTNDQTYTDLIAVIGAGMLGYGVALNRARTAGAEERATALARHEEDRLRAAVEQEQSRIAREVHDIVAHDVSVMVAQAAAARLVFAARPETAVDALASIEAVGRDALDGLRRLVWLLRTESESMETGSVDTGGTDTEGTEAVGVRSGSEQRTPQPRLDRLPWLVDQVRLAGLPVEFVVRGDAHLLPGAVELNAYRIIQEALTNSLKHSGRTGVSVTLDYRGESLYVEVRDLGGAIPDNAARPPSGGFGLISMQQRATMLGGKLELGHGHNQGFRVAFELPLVGTPR